MSRAKTTGSLGGLIFAALILMFPTQVTSFMSTAAGIFGKIVSDILLKALGL